ncbi:hypothetical protein BP5796_08387 [Coleophoma crateriformis]|uniref:Uncharacterized protein n=1 Tax=Coleophoma crateriformis TaxID=565419 RepID=A0A3D8R7T1_9HELO|nr:hypothetical protein BP5796_08387 [Coleophoma crateriformis]
MTVSKVPLSVRKNVRDGWEARIPGFSEELKTLLGREWTFKISPAYLFTFAEDDSYAQRCLGECISGYVEGFIYQLKRYLCTHGDLLRQELDTVVTSHSLTIIPSNDVNYCGCIIQDGVLELLFHPQYFGTNISDAAAELSHVLSSAPQSGKASALSFLCRHSIKTDYDAKINRTLQNARIALLNAELTFEPEFEDNAAKLKGSKDVRSDWESNLGDWTRQYFDGFLEVLRRQKFEGDELLQEGFNEAVRNGVVRLRVVDELASGYNEVILEYGDLIMQTTPQNWGCNTSDAAVGLMDIL